MLHALATIGDGAAPTLVFERRVKLFAKLLDVVRPTPEAKYIKFVSFDSPSQAVGQRQAPSYPWPYVEGLTLAEARNELAFVSVGLYQTPLGTHVQNGAPLRLIIPWKYGFKSIKSIKSITFTAERPVSFWEEIQPAEYGFWANVNPNVPHRRWSQAVERYLSDDASMTAFGTERLATQLYNGYASQVEHLYADGDTLDQPCGGLYC